MHPIRYPDFNPLILTIMMQRWVDIVNCWKDESAREVIADAKRRAA
jgi:hypothetical protein